MPDPLPEQGPTAVYEGVRARYASLALNVLGDQSAPAACCGSDCGCGDNSGEESFGAVLYDDAERSELPESAVLASLGCGNPLAVAELREGEVVLDLGSGGGIDVLLSAKRVGPSGKAYGLDMTDEMLELARRNAADAGAVNVEFIKGHIEAIPLPVNSIDVVISNCVINLSPDKPAVIREIYRVLRPGGRLGISDVVAEDRLTHQQRQERGSYVGCIAGALSVAEYRRNLHDTGFHDIDISLTHEVADGMHGAIVRGVKPSMSTQEYTGMSDVPEVLFVCVHNAGRSQMAAALLDHHAAGRVHVRSAGSQPASELNPAVVTAMREIGLDLSHEFPKPLTDDAVKAADAVITMGCGDACPFYPGKRYLDWELEDPAGKPIETVRGIRDQIDGRVRDLLAELTPATAET